jgi:hypothetical protein
MASIGPDPARNILAHDPRHHPPAAGAAASRYHARNESHDPEHKDATA